MNLIRAKIPNTGVRASLRIMSTNIVKIDTDEIYMNHLNTEYVANAVKFIMDKTGLDYVIEPVS